MNNGRIWCVVSPTVGLPLFLGSVTAIALGVHTAVLTNTNWMSSYWQGGRSARADAAPLPNGNVAQATVAAQGSTDAPFSVNVTPVAGAAGESAMFVVTITPRTGDQAQTVTLVQRTLPPGTASAPTAIR